MKSARGAAALVVKAVSQNSERAISRIVLSRNVVFYKRNFCQKVPYFRIKVFLFVTFKRIILLFLPPFLIANQATFVHDRLRFANKRARQTFLRLKMCQIPTPVLPR